MTPDAKTPKVRASEAFEARLNAACAALSAGFFVSDAALVPVRFMERTIGRTDEAHARSAARLPGASLRGGALVLPQNLEAFGGAMRDAGLSQGWRSELLDLRVLEGVDAQPGDVVGRMERALFRPLGAATAAVHLVGHLRRPASEADPVFILGRRSASKLVGPGLWDGLAAGMIRAGESPAEGLAREAAEEAGLERIEAADLCSLGRAWISRPVRGGWMHEMSFAYALRLPEGWRPRPVDGEVEHFEAMSALEVLELIEGGRMMKEAAQAMLLAFGRLLAS